MKTIKEIQEENRKLIILANNPEAKSYDEAIMDDTLKQLKDYLKSPFANMKGVCLILSKDNNAIDYVLDMLQNERKESQELIRDLALNASKSNMVIVDTKKTAKRSIPREPLIEETVEMFKKWRHRVAHFAKETKWARKNNLDL